MIKGLTMTMTEFQGLEQQFEERVIEIARVAKVVKGGRRFQFRVTVVIGDGRGNIGLGIGKANAVPDAMRKATERAHKTIRGVPMAGTTIPHEGTGRTAGAKVLLKPASAGTGGIAAGGGRAGFEAAGPHDIPAQSTGGGTVLHV